MAPDGPVRVVSESVLSELNKLKKSDLIEIVVHRRLPEGLATDKIALLSNIVSAVNEKCDKESHASDRVAMCGNSVCVRNIFECRSYKVEIDLLQKTIRHLEQRIIEQSSFIEILKPLIKSPIDAITKTSKEHCDKKHMKVKSSQETAEKKDVTEEVSSGVKTNGEKQVVNINKTEKVETFASIVKSSGKRETEQIKRNQLTRKKPIIGCNTDTVIQAVQKLGYLHVYRLQKDTTKELLHDFLKRTAPKIDFQCEDLRKTDKSASFRVCLPISNVKEVYNSEIWPDGSAVRRFIFPKKENFRVLSKSTTRG